MCINDSLSDDHLNEKFEIVLYIRLYQCFVSGYRVRTVTPHFDKNKAASELSTSKIKNNFILSLMKIQIAKFCSVR